MGISAVKSAYSYFLQQGTKADTTNQDNDYKVLIEKDKLNKVPLLSLDNNLLYYLRKQEVQNRGKMYHHRYSEIKSLKI